MATIIKSNVKYSGKIVLPSVIDLTKTAQEFYVDYASWVESDGGSIIDPSATLEAIAWAKQHGVLGKCHAVSARWGIKKTGNSISRVYGFNGDVFESAGGEIIHTTTNEVFPLIALNNNYLKQIVKRPNIRSKNVVIGVTAAKKSGSIYIAFGVNNGSSNVNSDLTVHIPTSPSSPNINVVGNLTAIALNLTNQPDYQSIVGYIDEVSVLGWNKGAQQNASATTSSLSSFSDASSSEIWLGKRMAAGAPYGSSGDSFLSEFWLINDASADIASDLSLRLASLH